MCGYNRDDGIKTFPEAGINSPCCFSQDSERRRGGRETQREKSKGELLLGTSWKLWTYSISDLRVDNLSYEGRALTVTNNYFWQPFNNQTYCPGSGPFSKRQQ